MRIYTKSAICTKDFPTMNFLNFSHDRFMPLIVANPEFLLFFLQSHINHPYHEIESQMLNKKL